MAHFLVTKSVDAYIKYSAVIEADNELDAVDEAQRNEGQYKWYRSHEVEFDQTEFFQDEVEELTAEEAAIEIAHSDENPSSARAQALEEILRELSRNPRQLIDMMASAIRDNGSDLCDGSWESLSYDRKQAWRGDAERALTAVKEYLTTRVGLSGDEK